MLKVLQVKHYLPAIRENVPEIKDRAMITSSDEITQITNPTPSFSRMGINMSSFDIPINSRDRQRARKTLKQA